MPDQNILPADRAELIERAAMWLSEQGYQQRPVPLLRERFSLSSAEACQAIGRANQMRTLRRAFG